MAEATQKVNGVSPGYPNGGRNGNWFAVSRMVFDHSVVGAGQPVRPADPKRGSFSKLEAWLWLIANAAYEQSRIMNKGRETTLNPGQLMGAYSYLSDTWNWTPETVRYFLLSLERAVMLYRENSKQKGRGNHNQCQVLSICNYERYQITFQSQPQAIQEAFEQAKAQANNKRTPSAPQESNTLTIGNRKEGAFGEDATEVEVNGVAIYGPGFKLDFGAIDIAAGLAGMDKQRGRQIAEMCARGWAADPSTKPANPMAALNRAIASDRNHKQVDEVRIEKAAKDTPGAKRERINRWAREAEEKFKTKPKEYGA